MLGILIGYFIAVSFGFVLGWGLRAVIADRERGL